MIQSNMGNIRSLVNEGDAVSVVSLHCLMQELYLEHSRAEMHEIVVPYVKNACDMQGPLKSSLMSWARHLADSLKDKVLPTLLNQEKRYIYGQGLFNSDGTFSVRGLYKLGEVYSVLAADDGFWPTLPEELYQFMTYTALDVANTQRACRKAKGAHIHPAILPTYFILQASKHGTLSEDGEPIGLHKDYPLCENIFNLLKERLLFGYPQCLYECYELTLNERVL